MKKYQLTGQPIYVGETYNHNGDLYRVESFDEGYTEPKVTLRRIKDGTIFDVEAPALFLTPTGVQLLWPREVNRFCAGGGNPMGLQLKRAFCAADEEGVK